MRKLLFLLLVSTIVGCSGADFNVAEPSATNDSAEVESSTSDANQTQDAVNPPDTNVVDSGKESEDTNIPQNDAGSTSPPDTGTITPDTAPTCSPPNCANTCGISVKNSCGDSVVCNCTDPHQVCGGPSTFVSNNLGSYPQISSQMANVCGGTCKTTNGSGVCSAPYDKAYQCSNVFPDGHFTNCKRATFGSDPPLFVTDGSTSIGTYWCCNGAMP